MSSSRSWERGLFRNPVYAREMKQAMRTGRAVALVLAASLLFGLLMLGLASAFGMREARVEIGPVYFQVFFSLAYFATCILGPPLAAIAMASERDACTWEALLLTGLDVRVIARAKFAAVASALAAFLVLIAPASALCFVLGGVPLREVIAAFAVLAVIAVIALAIGAAIGASSRGTASATLGSLASALAASLALYFAVGVGFSFLAHATWPAVPSALPVWLPLAYARAPLNAQFVLLLIAMPVAVTAIALGLCYEIAVASLSAPSDDRISGLKRWFVLAAPAVAAMAVVPGVMTPGANRTAWTWGLAGLVVFLAFAAFVLIADELAPSPRTVHRWREERRSAVTRLLGPGLVQTCTLVLIFGLALIGAYALVAAWQLWRRSPGTGIPPQAIAVFSCTAYWGAFLTFIAGMLLWSRVRANSARSARLLTTVAIAAAALAPWVAFLAVTTLSSRRADDALLLAAPSPAYALAIVRAIERGEPHLAMVSGVVCALGWAGLGLTLFGLGARQATKRVVQQNVERARVHALSTTVEVA